MSHLDPLKPDLNTQADHKGILELGISVDLPATQDKRVQGPLNLRASARHIKTMLQQECVEGCHKSSADTRVLPALRKLRLIIRSTADVHAPVCRVAELLQLH